jgi:hypothetical protein
MLKPYFFSGIKPGIARRTNAKGGSDKRALLCQGRSWDNLNHCAPEQWHSSRNCAPHPSQQKFFDLLGKYLPCKSIKVRFIHLVSFLAGACDLICFGCFED